MGLFGRGFVAGAVEPFLDEVKAGRKKEQTATATTLSLLENITLPALSEAEAKVKSLGVVTDNLSALGMDKDKIMSLIDKSPDALETVYDNIMKENKRLVDKNKSPLSITEINGFVQDANDLARFDGVDVNTYLKERFAPTIKSQTDSLPKESLTDTLFGWNSEKMSNKALSEIVFRETESGKVTALDLKRLTRTGQNYGYTADPTIDAAKITVDYPLLSRRLNKTNSELAQESLAGQFLNAYVNLSNLADNTGAYGNTFDHPMFDYLVSLSSKTTQKDKNEDAYNKLEGLRGTVNETVNGLPRGTGKEMQMNAIMGSVAEILYVPEFSNPEQAKLYLNVFKSMANRENAFRRDATLRVNTGTSAGIVEMRIDEIDPDFFEQY